jgi:hypothetical protein
MNTVVENMQSMLNSSSETVETRSYFRDTSNVNATRDTWSRSS